IFSFVYDYETCQLLAAPIYFREDMGIEEPADGVNFHCGKSKPLGNKVPLHRLLTVCLSKMDKQDTKQRTTSPCQDKLPNSTGQRDRDCLDVRSSAYGFMTCVPPSRYIAATYSYLIVVRNLNQQGITQHRILLSAVYSGPCYILGGNHGVCSFGPSPYLISLQRYSVYRCVSVPTIGSLQNIQHCQKEFSNGHGVILDVW
ncbi:hypothetical protein STEG23_001779, partial [Scotinomys teguina]